MEHWNFKSGQTTVADYYFFNSFLQGYWSSLTLDPKIVFIYIKLCFFKLYFTLSHFFIRVKLSKMLPLSNNRQIIPKKSVNLKRSSLNL